MERQCTSVLTRRGFLISLGLFGISFVSSSVLSRRNELLTELPVISKSDVKSELTVKNKNITTGYVYDPIFLKHTQAWHPESAQRLEAILAELKSTGLLESLQQIPSRAATFDELSYVHPASHIDRVKQISQSGGGHLDPDTYTTPDTYDAAAVAAGVIVAEAGAAKSKEVEKLVAGTKDDDADVRTKAWLGAGEVGAPAVKPLAAVMRA